MLPMTMLYFYAGCGATELPGEWSLRTVINSFAGTSEEQQLSVVGPRFAEVLVCFHALGSAALFDDATVVEVSAFHFS